jgi:hypothetical protein
MGLTRGVVAEVDGGEGSWEDILCIEGLQLGKVFARKLQPVWDVAALLQRNQDQPEDSPLRSRLREVGRVTARAGACNLGIARGGRAFQDWNWG